MKASAPWFFAKRPVFRFVALFGLVMVAYFALLPTPLVTEWLGPVNLRVSAGASVGLLRLAGENVSMDGIDIVASQGVLRIQRGCDIIGPAWLLIAAILACPVASAVKIPGILLGVPALFLINVVRIVSLYFAWAYVPGAFPTLHVAVWQPGIITVVLVLFGSWAMWAAKRPSVRYARPS